MIGAKRNIAYLLSMELILTSLPIRIFAQEGVTIPNSSTLLNTVESTVSSSLKVETTTSGTHKYDFNSVKWIEQVGGKNG